MGAEREMPRVWSVGELTEAIRRRLEGDFPVVDVEAEISGWKVHPSGHAYFTLKDAKAQISAVMFAADLRRAGDGFGDGSKVKVRAALTVYPPRGNYQLVVRRMRARGEGELMQRYLELKAKLEAEGLFRSGRKRPLPFLPRRIGLVTSEAGAVIHDMVTVLSRRFPNLEIRLFPALVQGAEAPPTLVRGLEYFNREKSWRADLVIIARGGGSFEDLFCFNDERLVRAVAASELPVVSAVGHETDFTLCDFAADIRCGTPSIAAETAVPVLAELRARLDGCAARLDASLRSRGDGARARLDRLRVALAAALRGKGDAAAARLGRVAAALSSALRMKSELSAQRLDHLGEALGDALRLVRERAETRLERAEMRLRLLSPYAVLERGYSITSDAAGNLVREASAVRAGDVLVTRLKDGEIRSRALKDEGGTGERKG